MAGNPILKGLTSYLKAKSKTEQARSKFETELQIKKMEDESNWAMKVKEKGLMNPFEEIMMKQYLAEQQGQQGGVAPAPDPSGAGGGVYNPGNIADIQNLGPVQPGQAQPSIQQPQGQPGQPQQGQGQGTAQPQQGGFTAMPESEMYDTRTIMTPGGPKQVRTKVSQKDYSLRQALKKDEGDRTKGERDMINNYYGIKKGKKEDELPYIGADGKPSKFDPQTTEEVFVKLWTPGKSEEDFEEDLKDLRKNRKTYEDMGVDVIQLLRRSHEASQRIKSPQQGQSDRTTKLEALLNWFKERL